MIIKKNSNIKKNRVKSTGKVVPVASRTVDLESFGFTNDQLRDLGGQIAASIVQRHAEVFGIDATKQIKPIVNAKVTEAIEGAILQRHWEQQHQA